MDTLIQTTEFLSVVLVATLLIDRAGLRLLVLIVSHRALARHRRRAGGSNRLVQHGLNDAANCRTPLSVADAIVSFCVFDVSEAPLRLHASIPSGKYWSLTCYGLDTSNFFSMNDQQLETTHARTDDPNCRSLTVVLCQERQKYKAARDQIVVETPGPRGIFLIRVLLNDPEDERELTTVMRIQSSDRVQPVKE